MSVDIPSEEAIKDMLLGCKSSTVVHHLRIGELIKNQGITIQLIRAPERHFYRRAFSAALGNGAIFIDYTNSSFRER